MGTARVRAVGVDARRSTSRTRSCSSRSCRLTGSTIGAVGGELAAVSMRSGKILWRFPVSSGTESSPMVVGNSVYFGDQGGTEYSLNIRTGHENWSFSTDGSIKAGAAYDDGNLYFGTYGGSFYAVNAKSGKEVWSASPGGEFYSTPAIAYGHVYVGNNERRCVCVRSQQRRDRLEHWRSGAMRTAVRQSRTRPASARRSTSAPTTAASTRSMPRLVA